MRQMKAIAKVGAGENDLELLDVAVPTIVADELLVEIRAIGVGIHDSYFLPEGISYPYPIGIEAAGVVAEVGDEVTGRAIGDRIAFVSSMQTKGGTWAEYAVVSGDALIVEVPAAMSFEQAAAIPVAGNTALRALHGLPVADGDSIFIAGASGAVGTFLIQLAHERGLNIAASASPKNHEYMRALGAVKVVDYLDPDWIDQVRAWMPGGVDAAVAVQPATTAPSMQVVRSGGHVVSVSGDPESFSPPAGDVKVGGIPYGVTVSGELSEMYERITAGEMHLEIAKQYAFSDSLSALEQARTRHGRGKMVATFAEVLA